MAWNPLLEMVGANQLTGSRHWTLQVTGSLKWDRGGQIKHGMSLSDAMSGSGAVAGAVSAAAQKRYVAAFCRTAEPNEASLQDIAHSRRGSLGGCKTPGGNLARGWSKAVAQRLLWIYLLRK